MTLAELQKKAREELLKIDFHDDCTDPENCLYKEFNSFLDSKIKEAYLAGAKSFEEAVRLEEWEYTKEEKKLGKEIGMNISVMQSEEIGWSSALSAFKEKSKKFWEEV